MSASELVVLRAEDVQQVRRILAYFVAGAVLPMEVVLARQAQDILAGAVAVTADGEVIDSDDQNGQDRNCTGLEVQRRSHE